MTICRYFLQGNCRFGDRCRFEHTEHHESRNYQDRSYGRTVQQTYGHDRYRDTDYSYYSNYDQYDTSYNANQRYSSPNRYQTDRYQSNDRYSYSAEYENKQYKGFNKEHQYDKYKKINVPQTTPSSQRSYSEVHYSENTYGQNEYRWQSDDYKEQRPHLNPSVQSDYKTSTPKSTSSFSFKVPESEIKREQYAHPFGVPESQIHAELVKEDAIAWELGEQWPFTCYFPYPDKPGFPGFSDVSPEELRYEAYKAQENNSFDNYVKTVHDAILDIKQKRDQLKLHTAELLSTIAKIRRGEDLNTSSTFAGNSSMFHHATESMVSETTHSVPQNGASTFSFKLPPESENSVKNVAASFSFKASTDNGTKTMQLGMTTAINGVSEYYTPFEQLTDEEKEQFNASTFTLGKIPTNPPPRALCG